MVVPFLHDLLEDCNHYMQRCNHFDHYNTKFIITLFNHLKVGHFNIQTILSAVVSKYIQSYTLTSKAPTYTVPSVSGI